LYKVTLEFQQSVERSNRGSAAIDNDPNVSFLAGLDAIAQRIERVLKRTEL